MWLYNAWADRVEGHVSFTKTMKREEGRGKEKEKEKKDSEEKGGRTKAEDRPRVTYNGSPTAESVIKHTQKTKTTWKTQKKKNYTNYFVVFCVREHERIYVCLSWSILDNEPHECPPEARGGQRSMIPGPSTALQEYWTTEVTHLDDNGVLAKGI